eukprot:scaffold19007_cov71-Phaeocystis_antarctica.AAC.1
MSSTRRNLRSPAFLRSASPFVGRSASAPFARSASPFVRLEKAVLGRLSEHQPRQEDIDHALPPALEDIGSEADTHSYRPSFASPRSTEYCCAICIELLLRPVVLSCGHRLCRGCWVRVLQGSQARAVASRTGYAACPLGRCEVRPCVPDVDLDLESEMRERIGFKQLAAHAAAAEDASLTEESAAVAAVNAWAAAGCTLDAVDELEAAQAVAAAAAAFDIDAAMLENNSWGEKLAFCRDIFCLLVTIAIIAAFLFILNDGGEVSGLPHAHTQRPQRLLMLAPPPSRIFTLHTSRVTPPAALP